jgi:hypothetical protein
MLLNLVPLTTNPDIESLTNFRYSFSLDSLQTEFSAES